MSSRGLWSHPTNLCRLIRWFQTEYSVWLGRMGRRCLTTGRAHEAAPRSWLMQALENTNDIASLGRQYMNTRSDPTFHGHWGWAGLPIKTLPDSQAQSPSTDASTRPSGFEIYASPTAHTTILPSRPSRTSPCPPTPPPARGNGRNTRRGSGISCNTRSCGQRNCATACGHWGSSPRMYMRCISRGLCCTDGYQTARVQRPLQAMGHPPKDSEGNHQIHYP